MTFKLWVKRHWWLCVAIGLISIVLLPYLFSRAASPWRQVAIHQLAGDHRAPERSETSSVRVAAYNIAHGRGLAESNWDGGGRDERQYRLDEIASLLKTIDADIVVLNEVDFDASWSYGVNQAEYLAEKAGFPFRVEGRNLDFRILTWRWRFGNAVLSKYPISNAQVIDLPGLKWWEPWLAGKKRGLNCEINVGGQSIRVLGVHLSHRSENLRVKSSQILCQLVEGSGQPTIVAGDLNSTPTGFPKSNNDANGDNAIDSIDSTELFCRLPESVPTSDDDMTFRSDQPSSVIDWILVTNELSASNYKVIDSELSDHRPVSADVRVLKGKR